MANALRYSYLRGPGGRFRNPYDHGCKSNCSDFILKGYNEDIECHEEDPSNEEGENVGMIQMQQISKLQNGNSNGNGQVAIDVNPIHHLQSASLGNMNGHASNCSHNTSSSSKHVKSKSETAPLGLGLGLGLGRNPSRPIVPS